VRGKRERERVCKNDAEAFFTHTRHLSHESAERIKKLP